MTPFVVTYAHWLHTINTFLLIYCQLTLHNLPQVAPALPNWYALGASAGTVAMGLAYFIENG